MRPLIKPGAVWRTRVEGATPTPVTITVIDYDAKTDTASVLLENVDRPGLRASASCKLELGSVRDPNQIDRILNNQPVADGWRLHINTIGTTRWWPLGDLAIPNASLALVNGQILNLRSPNVTVQLQNETAKIDAYQSFADKVLAICKPGNVWVGTEEFSDRPSHRIRGTVVEYRPDSNYVRWMFESVDDPQVYAVFHGKLQTSAPASYGWPIVLQQVIGHDRFVEAFRGGVFDAVAFDAEQRGFSLFLNSAGELRGVTGETLVKLAAAEPIKNFVGPREAWLKAMKPQAKWKGNFITATKSLIPARLTFAEFAEDGAYVRYILEYSDNPSSASIYEGRLLLSDAKISGFALTGNSEKRAAPPSKEDAGVGLGSIYTNRDVMNLRLSSDGAKLIGSNQQQERIELTADGELPTPIDLATFTKVWQSRIMPGTKCAGKLTALNDGQTADVTLDIQKILPDNTIEAQVTASRPRLPAVSYRGTLVLDRSNVNGFALRLRKAKAGTGTSMTLGDPADVVLELRLSPNGDRLYGRAGYRAESPTFQETLDLVVPKPRAASALTPVPAK